MVSVLDVVMKIRKLLSLSLSPSLKINTQKDLIEMAWVSDAKPIDHIKHSGDPFFDRLFTVH